MHSAHLMWCTPLPTDVLLRIVRHLTPHCAGWYRRGHTADSLHSEIVAYTEAESREAERRRAQADGVKAGAKEEGEEEEESGSVAELIGVLKEVSDLPTWAASMRKQSALAHGR